MIFTCEWRSSADSKTYTKHGVTPALIHFSLTDTAYNKKGKLTHCTAVHKSKNNKYYHQRVKRFYKW